MTLKKDKRSKKYIILIILFLVFFCSCSSYMNESIAAINQYYPTPITNTLDLNNTADDAIFNAIARLLYILAKWLEFFISKLMKMFVGVEVFPWADKVVFNTIGFLDINFINPAIGSLFKNQNGDITVIGEIVANMYYTIFIIAMAFLGVAVGIMAVRLTISSIASEKAKYKQAIQNWIFAIVLMFTTHYLISFIFFVNEKLVEVASSILVDKVKDISLVDLAEEVLDYNEEQRNTALNRLVSSYSVFTQLGTLTTKEESSAKFVLESEYGWSMHIQPNLEVVDGVSTYKQGSCTLYNFSKYTYKNESKKMSEIVNFDLDDIELSLKNNEVNPLKMSDAINKKASEIWAEYVLLLMLNPNFPKQIAITPDVNGNINFGNNEDLTVLAIEAGILTLNDPEVMRMVKESSGRDNVNEIEISNVSNISKKIENTRYLIFNRDRYFWYDITKPDRKFDKTALYKQETISSDFENINNTLVKVWKKRNRSVDAQNDNYEEERNLNFIGEMGEFFRESAYGYEFNDEGVLVNFTGSKNKFQPIGAILYAIFIFISLSFFIVYLKRLFYIIMLALFAPIVIIYDFALKAVS